jgi:hypothetical protein
MSGTGIINTLTASQQIELIYVGYFNRSGDSAGFFYWGNEYSADLTHGLTATQALNQIANEFQPQTETLALYPFLATQNPPTNSSQPGWASWVANVQSLVQSVYGNLFDRAADSDGLTYWTNQIATGVVPLGEAILAIANGATGADATLVTNKVKAALDFTTQTGNAGLGLTPETTTAALIAAAGQVLTVVTVDPASIATADAATQAFINSGAGAAQNLTPGVDHITGHDVFVSGVINAGGGVNNSTLNPTDTFAPSGANNSLNITLLGNSGANALNASTSPVLTNIQNLSVTNNSGAFHNNDLNTIAPALTTLNVVNGVNGLGFQNINGAMVQTFSISGAANPGMIDSFGFKAGLTSGGAATGAASLTLSNNANGLNVGFFGAAANDGIANLTVHSNGSSANALTSLVDPTLKVLTIDGSAAFSVANPIAFAGGKVDIEAAAATGALTLDVSGNGGKTVFNGGSGVNTFTLSDASLVTTGTALNGGSGAGNTLEVLNLNVLVANEAAAINATHGFDTLGLIDAGGNTIDASQITVLKHYVAEVGSGAETITNMASGSTVDVLRSNGGTDTYKALAVASSTLDLHIGNAASAGININLVDVTNFTDVNLTSNGTGQNTFFFTNTGVPSQNFTLAGSANTETYVPAQATPVHFDASAFTGAFFFGKTTGSITDVQVGDQVTYGTSGSGDTVLTGSGQTTVVEFSNVAAAAPTFTGLHADTITFLAGHSTQDAIISEIPTIGAIGGAGLTQAQAATLLTKLETVNHFSLGTDAVGLETNFALGLNQLTAADNAGAGQNVNLTQVLGNTVVVNANGLITSGYTSAADFLFALNTSNASAAGDVVIYHDAANTYVAESTGAAVGDWHVVELAGVTAHTGITNLVANSLTVSSALAVIA